MAMTNAERQARHRNRVKEKLAEPDRGEMLMAVLDIKLGEFFDEVRRRGAFTQRPEDHQSVADRWASMPASERFDLLSSALDATTHRVGIGLYKSTGLLPAKARS